MVRERGAPPRAVIFGVAGAELTEGERRFLAEWDPLGLILFARNCATPDAVRALVDDFRAAVGRADAPVLIDQEGGRVARLKPPHWRSAPAPAVFARFAAADVARACEACTLNARLVAAELAALGITVDTLPILDIPQPGADPVIGDRAAGDTPELAARLGRSTCEGLLAEGVLPVIKHIPGHGRAAVDSHRALPIVDASRDELERIDFAPFRRLADMPWAMTAHVVYTAIDCDAPATTSRTVIADIIRGAIGFDGLLLSDDLCMAALAGPPAVRAEAAVAAGCDVVLHCNGDLDEMHAVAAVAPPLSDAALTRLARGERARLECRDKRPADSVAARLEALMQGQPVARKRGSNA